MLIHLLTKTQGLYFEGILADSIPCLYIIEFPCLYIFGNEPSIISKFCFLWLLFSH